MTLRFPHVCVSLCGVFSNVTANISGVSVSGKICKHVTLSDKWFAFDYSLEENMNLRLLVFGLCSLGNDHKRAMKMTAKSGVNQHLCSHYYLRHNWFPRASSFLSIICKQTTETLFALVSAGPCFSLAVSCPPLLCWLRAAKFGYRR